MAMSSIRGNYTILEGKNTPRYSPNRPDGGVNLLLGW